METQNTTNEVPCPLASRIVAQRDALMEISQRITDHTCKKENAPTLKDIRTQLEAVSLELDSLENEVPGGLKNGNDVPLFYRKTLGRIPAEIRAPEDLAILSIAYRHDRECYEIIEKTLMYTEQTASDTRHIDAMHQNSRIMRFQQGVIIFLTIISAAAVVKATPPENQAFMVALYGAILLVGSAEVAVIYRHEIFDRAKKTADKFHTLGRSLTASDRCPQIVKDIVYTFDKGGPQGPN